MSAKRKLPILTEQSLVELKYIRAAQEDKFNKQILEKPKVCKKGCAHCCYHPVWITAMEGALLYQVLAKRGRWTPSFQAELQAHSDKTKDLSFEVWLLSNIPCPLLNTNTNVCGTYKERPYQCRATFAMLEPENCHPHNIMNSRMIDRSLTMMEFHQEQNRLQKRHKLQNILMPISMAILIGEKIIQGKLDMEDADKEVLRQFLTKDPEPTEPS